MSWWACERLASLTGVVVLAQAGRGTARGWPGDSCFWRALSLFARGLGVMVVVGRKVSPGVAQTFSSLACTGSASCQKLLLLFL